MPDPVFEPAQLIVTLLAATVLAVAVITILGLLYVRWRQGRSWTGAWRALLEAEERRVVEVDGREIDLERLVDAGIAETLTRHTAARLIEASPRDPAITEAMEAAAADILEDHETLIREALCVRREGDGGA